MKQWTTVIKTLRQPMGGNFAGILLALLVVIPTASSVALEASPDAWGENTPNDIAGTADAADGQEGQPFDAGICSLPVTPDAEAANQAPTVTAGADQVVTLSAGAVLTGAISDDGLPANPGDESSAWCAVSGPGFVTFASAASAQTVASFSKAGTYVLRLTATDGDLMVSDELTVTVTQDAPADQLTLTPHAPRISNLAVTSNGSQITWNAVPGQAYRLVYKDSLSDKHWLPASSDLVAIGNELTAVDETADISGRRFYSIVVVR